jgi:hypothetical protein
VATRSCALSAHPPGCVAVDLCVKLASLWLGRSLRHSALPHSFGDRCGTKPARCYLRRWSTTVTLPPLSPCSSGIAVPVLYRTTRERAVAVCCAARRNRPSRVRCLLICDRKRAQVGAANRVHCLDFGRQAPGQNLCGHIPLRSNLHGRCRAARNNRVLMNPRPGRGQICQ